MKKIILFLASISIIPITSNAQTWLVTGNNGITSSQFLGTNTAQALDFRTNGTSRMNISSSGYVGVGITPVSSSRLYSTISLPSPLALNSTYSGTRGRITAASGSANGYLGAYYGSTNSLTFPGTLTLMGVMGVQEISSSHGAGVVGWNKNNTSGGSHYGVYGLANGAPSGIINLQDKNIGVYGTASNGITNIGIYGSAPGTDDFAGYFNGRIYINNKVGIGTTTPSSTLHIDAPSGTSPFRLETDGTVRMYVASTGKIGVGTTIPSAKFHVRSTSDETSARVSNFGATSTAIYGLDIETSNLSSGMSVGTYSVTNGTGVNRAIEATATNGTTNYGVYSVAEAGSGNAYGVYGRATGGSSSNTVYGVYGTSSGSSDHWAGYFAGTTYASTLRVGTTEAGSGYALSVGGKVICEEVKVALEAVWPDYVFADDYKLISIDDLKSHILENNHLPGIPSAQTISEEGGHSIGEMQVKLLEKVEELTLYIIKLNDENKELKKAISELKN